MDKGKMRHKYREIWIKHHGPIPEGNHIHHIDGNRFNNDVSNLECVTPKEHGMKHRGKRGKRISRVYGTKLEDYALSLMPKDPDHLSFSVSEAKEILKNMKGVS